MKKLLFISQFPLFAFLNVSFFLGIIQLSGNTIGNTDSNNTLPVYYVEKDFYPSLQSINSIEKLEESATIYIKI